VPSSSALAASGDPSSALIAGPFSAAAQQLFSQELLYSASAAYTLLSNAIDTWEFGHDGKALPDTIPDLAAAFARKPSLRVLSLNGYHDVATPFHQTEVDLARLGAQPNLATRVYAGGHMTYLDDGSRPRLKADLKAFINGTPLSTHGTTSASAVTATAPTGNAIATGRTAVAASVGVASPTGRESLAQGGDPWLPPALRVAPAAPSPRDADLASLVRAKIAARDRDVYR
jgi:hypothetical protein